MQNYGGQIGTNNASNNGSNTDIIEFVKKCCSIAPYCVSYDDATSGERVYETVLLLIITDKETATPLHQGFYLSDGTNLSPFQQPTNAANVEYTAGSCGDGETISILNDIATLLEFVNDILNTLGITLENINENINDVNAELDAQTDILIDVNNELENQTTQLVDINAELDLQTALLQKCCASKIACITLADGSTVQVIVGYIFNKDTATLTLEGIYEVQANGTVIPYSLPTNASLTLGSCAELTTATTKAVQIQACDNTYENDTLTNSKPILIIQVLNTETGQPIRSGIYEITANGLVLYQPTGTVEFGECCKSCPTLLNIDENCIVFLDECDEANYDIVIDLDNKTLSVSVINNAFPLPAIEWQGSENVTIADPAAAETDFSFVAIVVDGVISIAFVDISLIINNDCAFDFFIENPCDPITLDVSVCEPIIFTENYGGSNDADPLSPVPNPNFQFLEIIIDNGIGEWFIRNASLNVDFPASNVVTNAGVFAFTDNSILINQTFIDANSVYQLGDGRFELIYKTECGELRIERSLLRKSMYDISLAQPSNTVNTTLGNSYYIVPTISSTVFSFEWVLSSTITVISGLDAGFLVPILVQGYGQGALTIETEECGIQTVTFNLEDECANYDIVVTHLVEQSISTSLALDIARSTADKAARQVCLTVIANDVLPAPSANLPNPASLILNQKIGDLVLGNVTNPSLHPIDPNYRTLVVGTQNVDFCVQWPVSSLHTGTNIQYQPLQNNGQFLSIEIDGQLYQPPNPITWSASIDSFGTQFKSNLLTFLQSLTGVGSYFANDAVEVYVSNNTLNFIVRVWGGDGMAYDGLNNLKYRVNGNSNIITIIQGNITQVTGGTVTRRLVTTCGTIDAELLVGYNSNPYLIFANLTAADILDEANLFNVDVEFNNETFCTLPAQLILSLPGNDTITSIIWQLSNGLTDTNGQTQILNTEIVEINGSGDYEVTVQTAAGCEYTTNGTV
ncbi:MAG: hypothetical protein ACPG5B_06785 [Chitinophagales bacterium]